MRSKEAPSTNSSLHIGILEPANALLVPRIDSASIVFHLCVRSPHAYVWFGPSRSQVAGRVLSLGFETPTE